jgi:hypothetical protein
MGSSAAVEVKSTSSRERFTVRIHGLLQLDPAPDQRLYLYAEQVERVPIGGDSVPDAIERLQSQNPGRALSERLALLGYDMTDEPVYRTIRYATLDSRHVRIDEDTPRLVRSSLRDPALADKVHNVDYDIDLDPAELPGILPDADPMLTDLAGDL